jgi:N-acetylmuramoyl-L-alanine amidase
MQATALRRLSVLPFVVWCLLASFPPTAAAVPAAFDGSANCNPDRFRVALDIGHSVRRPGATSASGRGEHEFNVSLASVVLAALAEGGFRSSFILESPDAEIPLGERTALAARENASILLSIHHDSVQPGYLQEVRTGDTVRRFSDRFHGFSVFVSAENARAGASRQLGAMLGEEMVQAGFQPSLHHAEAIPGEGRPLLDARIGLYRFDGLIILRTARMPAALLEAGVIVNRSEEQVISALPTQRRIAAAVLGAVRRACSSAAFATLN